MQQQEVEPLTPSPLLKSFVDWSPFAKAEEHVWNISSQKIQKIKCYACGISCSKLIGEKGVRCKPSFNEQGLEQEKFCLEHYFVTYPSKNIRCCICENGKLMKSISSSKLSKKANGNYSDEKDMCEKLLICLYCQRIVHNRQSCLKVLNNSSSTCDFGILSRFIVNPAWIVKTCSREDSFIGSKRYTNFKIILPQPVPQNINPLIVFVNVSSGSRKGNYLLSIFLKYLNPRQVFFLPKDNPADCLKIYACMPKMHILVCGGDGTIAWICSVIDDLDLNHKVTVSMVPLGTGNDLSNALNWGKILSPKFSLLNYIKKIDSGSKFLLDQWSIDVRSLNEKDNRIILRNDKFLNYFSFGADAAIAHKFHEARENNPQRFNSRYVNMLSYIGNSFDYILRQTYRSLHKNVQLICDFEDLTHLLHKNNIQIVLVLNIKSYASGFEPWHVSNDKNSKAFTAQSMDDGLIEVIGLSMTSMAKMAFNLGGVKIAQCRTLQIISRQEIHLQIDGEPHLVPPSIITIEKHSSIQFLRHGGHKRTSSLSSCNDLPSSFDGEVSDSASADYLKKNVLNLSEFSKNIEDKPAQTPDNSSSIVKLNMSSLISTFHDNTIINEIINKYFYPNWTLYESLRKAVMLQDHKTLLYLLNNYPSINLNEADADGNTSLHIACKNCDSFCISILILNGADPNVVNNNKESPISIIKKSSNSKEILAYIRNIFS